ncbi:MAG: hypothetical protein GY717_08010 [Rhodobacteraceae bacterium]|nr:hypothetical protein [Paracoccaceae bacterium]
MKPGIIKAIPYEVGQGFDEAALNTVKSHLLNEATFLQYTDEWFGPTGVLTALNLEVANAATDSLIAVQALITIKHDSLLEMILNLIIGDIIDIVGAIPVIGPALRAILSIAYSTAKFRLEKKGLPTTIKATVAELAEALETTLQSMVDASAHQLGVVNGNWGKLKTFAEGVIDGTISADKLGATVSGSGGSAAAKVSPKVDPGFIVAVGNGWEIAFFQAMYPICLQATNVITAQSPPSSYTQAWNPAQGNYQYLFTIPTVMADTSGKEYDVDFLCSCTPNGTPEVMDRLFKPDQLAVDPISFFMGVNGWTYVQPVMNGGKGSATPDLTIKTIG